MTAMRKASRRYTSCYFWELAGTLVFVSHRVPSAIYLSTDNTNNVTRLATRIISDSWSRIDRMFIKKKMQFGFARDWKITAGGWWVRWGVSFAGTWVIKFFVYANRNRKSREKRDDKKIKRQRLRRRVISEETLTQLSYCCGWDDQL